MARKKLSLHPSGRWYYRQHIPLDLREHFSGREDIAQSLKTSSYKDAQILSARLESHFLTLFTLLRAGTPREALGLLLESTGIVPCASVVSVKLSELFNDYLEENSPNWKKKSVDEIGNQLQVLLAILGGDREVKKIDRAACLRLRDQLQKIPAGWRKKKKLKDLLADELVTVEEPGLTIKTVNKYTALLSTVFVWAVKQRILDHNPAAGLAFELEQRPEDERRPYDREDLQRVIDNLPSNEENSARKWVPLVAMFSGLRLEEICQMLPADIREIEGVPCFVVDNSGDKEIKTKAAKRVVPVHPILIRHGLLEYIDQRARSPQENAWGLKRGKYGYSKQLGKWFGKFNRRHVTADKKKCFHSFRHSVSHALKTAGVPELVLMEILGHANENISSGRYGGKFPPALLLDAVKKIDYEIKF